MTFIPYLILFYRFNVDCSETESFYNLNEKIGSEEPLLTDEGSLSSGRKRPQENRPRPQQNQATLPKQKRPQNSNSRPKTKPLGGVSSASILGTENEFAPQLEIDLVEYDATLPDDYDDDVPVLLADPFRDIEPPLSLYGAPPRG